MRITDVLDLDAVRAELDIDGDGDISDGEITSAIAGAIDLAALGALAGPGGALAGRLAEAADIDEVIVRGLVRGVRLLAGLVREEVRGWRQELPELAGPGERPDARLDRRQGRGEHDARPHRGPDRLDRP